jgi:ribonuclease HI
MNLDIYTDGSATVSTKPGGWAFVVVLDGQKIHEENGCAHNVTNNDMELQAIIQSLIFLLKKKVNEPNFLNPSVKITIYSDSQIALRWASGNGAFKQQSKMAKYITLQSLMERLKPDLQWIKGHSGNEFNERCDKLANEARKSLIPDSVKVKKKSNKIGDKFKGVMCVQYGSKIKLIDLDKNRIEDYNEKDHGIRTTDLIWEDKNG